MASNETDLVNAVLPWILGIITVIGSIYGSMKLITRYLICRGKNQANGENRIKHIEDQLVETSKKLEDLEQSFKEKEDKANTVHTEIKEGIAKINGILETMQKTLES